MGWPQVSHESSSYAATISFQIKLSLFPAGIQLFILLWVMDAFETITQSLHFYHDYATELYKDSDRVLQFDHVEANFLNL